MAKIKISELSIGDWVVLENLTFKVIGINPPYVDLLGNGNRLRLSDIDNDNLSPIRLTPEILEKNRFRLVVVNKNFNDWHDNNITIRKYYNEDNYHLFVCGQKVAFKMLFIHQLQHALRLAGVGKEIEV